MVEAAGIEPVYAALMTHPAKKLPSAREGVFLVLLGLVCAYLFAAPGEPLLGFGGSIAYLVGVLAGFFVGGMASRSLFAGKRKSLGVALGVALVALLAWWRATGHTAAPWSRAASWAICSEA
jgi:hypothetical protein